MYFVYDSLRTVTFEIYGVLVSGFISLALYFMKEAIHISFRGTFRNQQNFFKAKTSFKTRHFTVLFMINNYGFRPHSCYQNESSYKGMTFQTKASSQLLCSLSCCLMWTLSRNRKSFCMFICLRLRINNINHNIASRIVSKLKFDMII